MGFDAVTIQKILSVRRCSRISTTMFQVAMHASFPDRTRRAARHTAFAGQPCWLDLLVISMLFLTIVSCGSYVKYVMSSGIVAAGAPDLGRLLGTWAASSTRAVLEQCSISSSGLTQPVVPPLSSNYYCLRTA